MRDGLPFLAMSFPPGLSVKWVSILLLLSTGEQGPAQGELRNLEIAGSRRKFAQNGKSNT